ncbi:Dcm Site-specific DNA methylase [uncultured Caudovirales phage]|uniref:DNA (cytosine-5-)-methyltransferase n=1 Tax=uncultured Caudovirales phage TaxID=2100421 RepID=A0A6J5M0B0_9CAUD|nr:Dcm Site-specific DNA methylase [uncultured Caudovirales phage]
MTNSIKYLIVDLFCGAGGTSTGFEQAMDENGNRIAKVIAAVNHDHKAIESHWKNHPHVIHYEEDIRTLDLTDLIAQVKIQREMHPDAMLILWASLECTNFSKAKGGKPRDADSRTLADHLPRYVTAINPEIIKIENVVEFMSWGPLDENGKPISRKNGSEWLRWRKEMCALGYRDDWRELNSADLGAYTSRNRLFGIFVAPGIHFCWPEPTHHKNPGKASMFTSLLKWKAVKDVLDLQDEGSSIFERKKPLVDKTLERIYHGLIKYVAGGKEAFITKFFSGKPQDKNISIDGPAGTLTTTPQQGLVTAQFLMKRMSTDARTGQHRNASIENPAPTITTQRQPELVTAFMANYYSNGNNTSGMDEPSRTIRTGDGHSLVFIMDTQFGNTTRELSEPMATITASRKHHYIVNPSHGGHSTSSDVPCPVIVARQDKAPLYVVAVEHGHVQVAVYPDDTDVMIRIKEFMVLYGIVDIKMRMLKVEELLRIQGFPDGYYLAGNQADQKKFIGNSVHPIIPKVWIEAMAIKRAVKEVAV